MSSSFIVAGLDEAGRGPWAGPLVAAAVILPSRVYLPGLGDSKVLSEEVRERLYELITQKAYWAVGIVSNLEIDHYGLTKATAKAFLRALQGLSRVPDRILIDGRDVFSFPYPTEAIIKGDAKIRCISAASIVAKVTRDRLMRQYALLYNQYGFERHKGYGTRSHQNALACYGVTPLHRRSYSPVYDYL